MITRILHIITDISASRRGKFLVMVIWLVMAVGLTILAPKLAALYNNDTSQSVPANADSQLAQKLIVQEFPRSVGTPATIVFFDPQGLTVDDRFHIHQVNAWLTSSGKPSAVSGVVSPFTVPQASRELLSTDGTTMTMIVNLQGPTGSTTYQNSVQAMRDKLQKITDHTTLQANVTGPAGIITDLASVFRSIDITLLLTTIGLVFVLLIILYRSPLLALLPLVAVGVANMVVTGILGILARYGGISVSQMSTSIATVLLFGAGTDYSIFIASRFREELVYAQDKHIAMRHTMRAVGEAITSSAGTVILAVLTLLFATLGLYSSLGLTLALTIAVMLLAGLTLVPALITWLGRAAYWPFVPRYAGQQAQSSARTEKPHGMWGKLGQWAVKHRLVAIISSVLLLVLLALGNITSQPSLNFLSSFRVASGSTRGYAILQQHFSAGTLAPTTVLIQFRGADANAYHHLAQIDTVTNVLQKLPAVARVEGPTRPLGVPPTIDPTTLQANIAALPAGLRAALRSGSSQSYSLCGTPPCQPLTHEQIATIGAFAASSQYVSPDNTTIQLSIALNEDPYSLSAIQQMASIRATITRALATHGLEPGAATTASFHLAGQTSQLADTLSYNQRDTFVIVPGVLVLVFLMLALLLRSLIAPLYLLVAVTLNFLAAIGICSFFFQYIQGQDGFNYAIPLYTFIFLVALGADYTIFLMSRVREEAQRRGLEDGVAFAVSRTGGVITSAGLILAGTFLVLTTLPLTLLYQLGVCVAVGILMDTFIVRGLLVPGLVALLAKWNWWPGKLKLSLLLLVALLTGCAGGATAQNAVVQPTPTSATSIPVVSIIATEYGYIMSDKLNIRAGYIDFATVNNGSETHQTQVARLKDGVTNAQVLDKLVKQQDEAAAYSLLDFVGGPDVLSPGYGQEAILKLDAGQYALLCFVIGQDGVPHTSKGMVHFFTVSSGQSSARAPTADGLVTMKDFSYTLPDIINTSQPLLLQVTNQGTEAHEFNIVRLEQGKTAMDLVTFFQSLAGPPPFEELGGLAAIEAGGTAWIKIHLEPGNYAAYSFTPDTSTGQPQLSLGMITSFTVH